MEEKKKNLKYTLGSEKPETSAFISWVGQKKKKKNSHVLERGKNN